MGNQSETYMIQVERDSIRSFYGPIVGLKLAEQEAKRIIGEGGANVVLVHVLLPISATTLSHIHPNQTTIQDHIGDIADAVI